MEILIIGTEDQEAECRQKFGQTHSVRCVPQAAENAGMETNDIIFDFDTPKAPSRLVNYPKAFGQTVFFDTSLVRLSDLLKQGGDLRSPVFGFCGLRTFVNRELLEVTLKKETDRSALEMKCSKLGTEFRVVKDQAGMVTPRVICMIINEAYFTLEEGTATRDDIDLAMKLGTNYPWGPFEWGERIGLGNVVRLLDAVRLESADDRYEVCSLLRNSAH